MCFILYFVTSHVKFFLSNIHNYEPQYKVNIKDSKKIDEQVQKSEKVEHQEKKEKLHL